MSETIAHNLETKFRTGDVQIDENINFDGLFLSKPILQGLNRAGFVRPSPIQLKAIPVGRCGLDLIIQAKSGTGKTCVFTVIALESVLPATQQVQALILAPTREIAFQTAHVVQSIGSCMQKLRSYAFTGGIPVSQDKLKLKCCHIATGTPGRIRQLIQEHTMITDCIRLFVLDEADKLLDEGFQDDINWIYSRLPEHKQIIAASATYPEDLAQFLIRYMRNPTFVRLNSSDPALLGVKQFYQITSFHPLPQKVFEEKVKGLLQLLNKISFNQCIIFSNFQARAQTLCDLLTTQGWPTLCVSGGQDQEQRMHVMSTLQKFQCRILISTDLISRGIDAEHVNLVINMDVPFHRETYLHRIGRAGRFGTVGIAVTFASKGKEEESLQNITTEVGLRLIPLPEHIDNTIWKLDNVPKLVEKQTSLDPNSNPVSDESNHKSKTVEPSKQLSKDDGTIKGGQQQETKIDESLSSQVVVDNASNKKLVHQVISRCQSLGNDDSPPPISDDEEQPIHPVIGRCQSLIRKEETMEETTKNEDIQNQSTPAFSLMSRDRKDSGDWVEYQKTDQPLSSSISCPIEKVEEVQAEPGIEETAEYVPTSVKNRIHEFERYIVKLINTGNTAKGDVSKSTPTETTTRRPMLKDLKLLSSIDSSIDSEKSEVRKSQSGESNPVEKKLSTKSVSFESKTIVQTFPRYEILPTGSVPSLAEQESLDDEQIQEPQPEEMGADVVVRGNPESISTVQNVETEIDRVEVVPKFDLDNLEPKEKVLVTRSFEDLLSDLESYIDSQIMQSCAVGAKKVAKLDENSTPNLNDQFRNRPCANSFLNKQIGLLENERDLEELEQSVESYEKSQDDFNSVIRAAVNNVEVVSDLPREVSTEKVDVALLNTGKVVVDIETDFSNKCAVSFKDDQVVVGSEESDVNVEKCLERASLDKLNAERTLVNVAEKQGWLCSSSSVDPAESENEKETDCSEDTDLVSSEVESDESSIQGVIYGEAEHVVLDEETTTENENVEEDDESTTNENENVDEDDESTTEETESSSEGEESQQSGAGGNKSESKPSDAKSNSTEFSNWTEYWQEFSNWASRVHEPGESDNVHSGSPKSPNPPKMVPPFGFSMPFALPVPFFPSPVPQMPQMPPMWGAPPQTGGSSFSSCNSCCNCVMSAWCYHYWSFYQWQMMLHSNANPGKKD